VPLSQQSHHLEAQCRNGVRLEAAWQATGDLVRDDDGQGQATELGAQILADGYASKVVLHLRRLCGSRVGVGQR